MPEPSEDDALRIRAQLESGDYATRERADDYIREMARRKAIKKGWPAEVPYAEGHMENPPEPKPQPQPDPFNRQAAQLAYGEQETERQAPKTARQALADTADKAVSGKTPEAITSAGHAAARMQENLQQPLTPEEVRFLRAFYFGPYAVAPYPKHKEPAYGAPAPAASMHQDPRPQTPPPEPPKPPAPPPQLPEEPGWADMSWFADPNAQTSNADIFRNAYAKAMAEKMRKQHEAEAEEAWRRLQGSQGK